MLTRGGSPQGSCHIRFEAAGPNADRLVSVPFRPNQLRSMAGWVYDQCVGNYAETEPEPGTQGGYVTKNIFNPIDYITEFGSDFAGFAPRSWREWLVLDAKCSAVVN